MRAITTFFTRLMERFMPDALLFALGLGLVVILMATFFANGSFLDQIQWWGDGLWGLNDFAMQMALILITGSCMAKTNVIKKFLRLPVRWVKGPVSASLLVTSVSMIACTLNWGLGLIVGALIATEVARYLKRSNYALLLANAYSGFVLWHGGLSGSIPLKLTDPSGAFKNLMPHPISIADSLGGRLNLWILGLNAIAIIALNIWLAKVAGLEDHITDLPPKEDDFDNSSSLVELSWAQRLEFSPISMLILVLVMATYLVSYLWQGKGVTINLVIFIFLMLSVFFSGNLRHLVDNFSKSVRDASGILLQFPFYSGLMAVMEKSGLAHQISEFFVTIATPKTFLFLTYLAAGLVNVFVPSGGGQWAVQGPIMLPAAHKLGVDLTDTAMMIAWGDAWTNMIQPFWALPLLAIAGIRLSKLMSYTVLVLLVSGAVTSGYLLLLH